MRMAAPDRVEPSFVHDMLEATKFQGDESYFARLAREAPATVQWIASHGVEFHQPTYYLAKGPPRIQPVGGGAAIFRELTRAAHPAGVGSATHARRRRWSEKRMASAACASSSGEVLAADAVVLACGGFQGNADMMREHFGPGGESIPLLAPRARFNTGDGIAMARALGADVAGEWNGMHIEPVDPRSKGSAPVVLLYPYGIVVDRNGRRFFDEGAGLVHETWEWFSRHIHFAVDGREAYAILDSRLLEIADWQRATRSEVPPFAPIRSRAGRPHRRDAAAISRPPSRPTTPPAPAIPRVSTPRAATGSRPTRTLAPPKSNWARAIAIRRSSPGR